MEYYLLHTINVTSVVGLRIQDYVKREVFLGIIYSKLQLHVLHGARVGSVPGSNNLKPTGLTSVSRVAKRNYRFSCNLGYKK
jgi:hypothetical protein